VNPIAKVSAVVVLSLCVVACGKTYDIAVAPGFVKLQRTPQDLYDWRAVAPDGVAVGLRVVPTHHTADLSFWTNALALRMRETEGYALLATKDVWSLDRALGRELVFGHDEGGKPFLYRVRLFLGTERLYVFEAGGVKEQMGRYAQSVDWMFASVRVEWL
jgi:hypothetical protein